MFGHTRLSFFLICALTLFALTGCGASAPTHFYGFSPMGATALDESSCLSVGVGPVSVASYLNRDSVVTRDSANRLQVSEFNQWIEPIEDGLSHAVADNLSGLICVEPIAVYPWPIGITPDYQVSIQLQRLDGILGKTVSLKATWSIVDNQGKLLKWSSFSDQTACGPTYDDLAASASQLIVGMTKDIATELKTLAAKRSSSED